MRIKPLAILIGSIVLARALFEIVGGETILDLNPCDAHGPAFGTCVLE